MIFCSCASVAPDDTSDPADVSDNFPYTFTDSTGASITLDATPETVAILFSSYADIWQSAGGTIDVTVGEAIERGFADEGAILVDPGSGHSTIDLETLVAAEPDLVIGTADYACQAEAAEFCRSAGIPAAAFTDESFDDYLALLRICCDITGAEDRYTELGVNVKAQIDGLKSEVESYLSGSDAAPPEILFVRAGSSDKSTKAKTAADNFVCVMLEELGAVNIADSQGELTGSLSLELIIEADPDFMFITTMGDEAAAIDHMTSKLSESGWRELSCVKDGNYEFLPKELFHFKPNSRWAEAYRHLAAMLYPELGLE